MTPVHDGGPSEPERQRRVNGSIWTAESGPVDGPLVVMVHGSMDRSAGLLRTGRRLAERCRVVRYDRRGYGRSAPHPGPFGLDQQLDDLVAVLDGRPATLFGHSYGGNVALALADRQPALALAVAIYETPLSWIEWWPGTTAGGSALAVDGATAGDPADAAERFMRRLVGDDRWERLPPSTRASRRNEGRAMVGELTDLRQRPPWVPARIAVPVVAMFGERGAAHHRRGMEHVTEVLADCRLVMVPGARHFGPNTHPDALAAVITELAAPGPAGDSGPAGEDEDERNSGDRRRQNE